MFPGIDFEVGGGGCGTNGIAMHLFWADFSWEKLLLGGDWLAVRISVRGWLAGREEFSVWVASLGGRGSVSGYLEQ